MRRIWMILLLALTLSGCKTIAEIKPDTIVDIPLHPTEAQTQAPTELTEAPTEAPTETEPATEMTEPTQAATQPARNNSSSGGVSSGNKKTGKGSSGSKTPATEPPTKAPTQPPTEAPTQPITEPPTEAPTDPPSYDPSGYSPGSLDRAIADAVNVQRQAEGLSVLTLDNRLCAIASVRAWETSCTWGHTRPNGSAGITVLDEYGYGHSTAAENIYFGTGSAGAIVDKWMSSDARRDNILMESAATIGVGSFTSADGLTYVAVFFVG